jgi:acetyl-CoA acetyltransferase
VFEANLDPELVAFSDVMACSTSFIGALAAAGMVGRSDIHLALVGGVETMSHRPIALRPEKADQIASLALHDTPAALALIQGVTPQDFLLPANAWANRVSAGQWGSTPRTPPSSTRSAVSRRTSWRSPATRTRRADATGTGFSTT